MPFPKRLLADHEKVVFDLKPHWISLLPSALWTVASVVLAIASFRYIYDRDGSYQGWEIGLTLLQIAAWYWFAVLPALRWYFTHFVLTSDRLITRQGVVAKHSKEIPLERINDVAFSQTVLERFLGAGDLMVESAGERGQTRITNVRKPEQVQLMIYKATESNTDRMMQPGGGKTGAPIDQLERLAKLKESGAISEAEYEEKKKDLLGRM